MTQPMALAGRAMFSGSPISALVYAQTRVERIDRALGRIFDIITLIKRHWRRAIAKSDGEQPSAPTFFAFVHRRVPTSLMSNISIAGSLDHLYTTTPALPSTTTTNTEADDVQTMARNAERFIRDTLCQMDVFLCANRDKLGPVVFERASMALTQCHARWYDPLLEPQQVHGLDSTSKEDCMGQRMALTMNTRTVNPWLYLMVMDFLDFNQDMLYIHRKLTAMERNYGLL